MLDFMFKSLEYMCWSIFVFQAYLFALFCGCLAWDNMFDDRCMLGLSDKHNKYMLGLGDKHDRCMFRNVWCYDWLLDVC